MSSGSESDEDYVPGEPEQVSEEGSADEETDLQYEKELDHKVNKRKSAQDTKGKKKRKTRNGGKESDPNPEVQPVETEEVLDEVDEKKRVDDLWAKFLEGTDKPSQKATPKVTTSTTTTDAAVKPIDNAKSAAKTHKQNSDDNKAREKRIFEFAGETIVVENNVIKEKIKTAEASGTVNKFDGPSRSRSGGLSGILGQLNKTDKLTTLEKSKLDWVTYKQDEGIEEEIQSHNKGKSGYLDRQDFLERADHRQYEIERDLRMSRRSNR